jgi:hypothetical protein
MENTDRSFTPVHGSIALKYRTTFPTLVALLAATLLVSGCADDDDDDPLAGRVTDPPAAPELTLTPQSVKTFRFSWDKPGAVSAYRLLVNPDGVSGYSEVVTFGGNPTEYDLSVFLPARLNASYILEACNRIGCAESDAVFVNSALTDAIGYVKASDTDVNDGFGRALAIADDGRTLAIGAPGDDGENDSASASGAVYVLHRDDAGDWRYQAQLRASNPDALDQFGEAIALDGDGRTLAVGAAEEDSASTGINGPQADNGAPDSGAVYMFRRDEAGAWSQSAYIKASNSGDGDAFGASLALSSDGGRLAVGAYGEASATTGINGNQSDDSAANAGAAYVFDYNGSDWAQSAYLKASNAEAMDLFGLSLALSGDGNTLVAGALREASAATGISGDQGDNTAATSGAVYAFQRDSGGDWTQQAYIKASNSESGDNFGRSLALDENGETLAVGANQEDSATAGVGADQNDNSALSSGAVYVFKLEGSNWAQKAYLKPTNPGAGDSFGFSLALSGDGATLAVGANGEASAAQGMDGDQTDDTAGGSGAAYLFRNDAGVWHQSRYLKAPNTNADDNFGYRVALAADGETLAIGADREDSNATGVDGDQADNSASNSGAVYLY